jgi:hypothetical protein
MLPYLMVYVVGGVTTYFVAKYRFSFVYPQHTNKLLFLTPIKIEQNPAAFEKWVKDSYDMCLKLGIESELEELQNEVYVVAQYIEISQWVFLWWLILLELTEM